MPTPSIRPRSPRFHALPWLLAALSLSLAGWCGPDRSLDPHQRVLGWITTAGFERLAPVHREMLLELARMEPRTRARPVVACWSEATEPETILAFERAYRDVYPLTPSAYYPGTRWSETATDGAGLGEGDPTVLTWGLVPDGLSIPGWGGEQPSPSILIQLMDGIHGEGPGGDDLTQRPWFHFFEESFAAWGENIGIQYVYEPNDDGAEFGVSPGVAGVRPDIRLSAHPLDGEGALYGYNDFPNGGDMVLDSRDRREVFGADAYDYRILRNLIEHEHGHGLGLTHACPQDGSKLMEPIILDGLDGPQEDDIIWIIRPYGDRWEIPGSNDDPGSAYDLGTILPGDTVVVDKANIDGVTDLDYYRLELTGRMRLTVRMIPTGESFYRSPDEVCSKWRLYDAATVSDLALSIHDGEGALLTFTDSEPAGGEEYFPRFIVPGAGTYFVRVTGDPEVDEAQRYELELTVDAGTAPVAQCRTDATFCRNTLTPYQLNDGSYDPDGDPLTYRLEPPGPYPPGENQILFIADDGALTDTCEALVTVNAAPVAACRNLVVAADTAGCGAVAVAAAALDDGSLDPEGKELTFALDPPGPFPPGTTEVKFLAIDPCGAADTCTTTIEVECSVPVRLLSFRAHRQGDGVVVTWETEDGSGSRFDVHREAAGGPRERLTAVPLSGRDVYEFLDPAPPEGALRYWLKEIDRTGTAAWHGPLEVAAAGPIAFRASALAPNPFRATASLGYSLPSPASVRIDVYDVRGRRVRALFEGTAGAGSHRAEWDGTADSGARVAAGLYLLRLQAGDRAVTRKVVYSP